MRVTTQIEFSLPQRGNADREFYVPSAEEVRGYLAAQAGNMAVAGVHFDAAIARNPRRGSRVYHALSRAGSPLAQVYWNFFKAELERSPARTIAALEEVVERREARWTAAPTQWLQRASAWLRPPDMPG